MLLLLFLFILENSIEVVSNVNEVEEAIWRNFVPERVSLVLVAIALAWVHELCGIDNIIIRLSKARKTISEFIHVRNTSTSQSYHSRRIKVNSRNLKILFLVQKGVNNFNYCAKKFLQESNSARKWKTDLTNNRFELWKVSVDHEVRIFLSQHCLNKRNQNGRSKGISEDKTGDCTY